MLIISCLLNVFILTAFILLKFIISVFVQLHPLLMLLGLIILGGEGN